MSNFRENRFIYGLPSTNDKKRPKLRLKSMFGMKREINKLFRIIRRFVTLFPSNLHDKIGHKKPKYSRFTSQCVKKSIVFR